MRKIKRKTRVTKKAKRKQQENHKKRSTKLVRLKCSVMKHKQCKKMKGIWFIDTTKPEIYTKEVRKNWVCLLCRDTNIKRR